VPPASAMLTATTFDAGSAHNAATGVPILVVGAVIAVATAVPLLGWLIFAGPSPTRRRSQAHLLRGLPLPADLDDAPVTPLSRLARRAVRRRSIARLERLLPLAGRPPEWPLERLVVAKFVLGSGAAALSAAYLSAGATPLRLLMAGLFTLVLYFLPELLLHSRGQKRQKVIQLELADTLDQMTIAVEAGLGFESAMARAGENGKGPLAEELVRTLQEIRVGQSRHDAYLALADRTTVADLRRFIRAVVQADTYGTAISEILRVQAKEIRLKRRQRAEEKAMQIPVKVIFPLILCILPTLFIVLLGPAVMDMMKVFGST
jgi:tight adherence protein C